MIEERWYQVEAEQALYRYFAENPPSVDSKGVPIPRNPLIAMPTGTGKSVVIGNFVANALKRYPQTRVMMLTHVKELIAQNALKLSEIWPQAPYGIYSAGLKKREINSAIIYAGVASIKPVIADVGHVDILVIDEAHLLSPNGDTMYQSIIASLRKVNPWLVVIGFTATPYRLGIGLLTNNGIFTSIAYDLTSTAAFNRLVYEGYIAPLIAVKPTIQVDLTKVGMSGGDYKAGELAAATDKNDITDPIVRDMIWRLNERNAGLIFAAGVEHAEHISECFSFYGCDVPAVHSKMEAGKRDQIIADFKRGRYRAVVNNNVLTTGFDHPPIDFIGMVRGTTSCGLWVQMLGRGTRPSVESGKQNCLVADYVGNTLKLGPINDPNIPQFKEKGAGVAPVWACDACGSYNHARAPMCIYCGNPHDMTQDMNSTPSSLDVMVGELPVYEYFNVNQVIYMRHEKTGKPDSMRVDYHCGLQRFTEYVCLEHPLPTAKHARDWWRQRFRGDPPEKTSEAIDRCQELAKPVRIQVWINTKYPRIVRAEF